MEHSDNVTAKYFPKKKIPTSTIYPIHVLGFLTFI